MIRWPLATLAGTSLALLLFWGLALLVTPPEAEIDVSERAMALNLAPPTAPPTEQVAERSAAPQAAEPLLSAPSAPAPVPAPPSPPPPAPVPDSTLSLPEASLPEPPVETSWENAELDTALPEPAEARPTPEPTPEPPPAPAPAPEPETQPESRSEAPPAPADTAVPREAVAASGQGAPSVADQSAEVVRDVGQATPTRRVPPAYPRRAQRRGLEGHVVLEFLVRPDGRVKPDSIRVVEARPGNVFDRAARQAVAQWRFAANGHLRRARQRLEFQLR